MTARAFLAALGYVLGLVTAATGIGLVAGLGWALIAAGIACSASCLLLIDTGKDSP
jgi:ABC-type transport system involved in cytochrome bd biosynthesis fused ATPase/permease subunit